LNVNPRAAGGFALLAKPPAALTFLHACKIEKSRESAWVASSDKGTASGKPLQSARQMLDNQVAHPESRTADDMNNIGEQRLIELLIFEVGGQRFGLPVADVREIVRAVPPIPLAGAPAGIEGVVNVRGNVVPILDIRQRFRLPARPIEYTDHLVIAFTAGRLVALRVDRALDLVRLGASDLEDLPGVSGGESLTRIAKLPEDLVLIQDLRALLSQADTAALQAALPAEGGD
jgi:purine-binding chemotaxis protein CheW